MKADKHKDEAARLAALQSYQILDTEAEIEFDEIVRVVSEICGMPVSLISLVDADRQWFKARSGIEITQTPIEMSVCAHGILQPDLLEIEDTTKDIRTIDNPIVKGEPHLRFYAGAALLTDDGLPMGMLCVLDYKPRKLTDAQRDLLQVMARLVMRQMELRRVLRVEQKARTLVTELLERANSLLERNETLRREIDHRVKNSLAQVAGYLRIQERQYRDEPKITAPLAEARNRVMSIVSVHDHLHRLAEDDKTSVRQFLLDLCAAVSQNRPPEMLGIEVTADATKLPSDKVMAIGLAINEFVSNSMKHAFHDGRQGYIRIDFHADGTNAVLQMRDEGPGLPANFDFNTARGLGLRVIASLAQQLGGTMVHDAAAQGTSLTLTFPLPPSG